MRLKRRPPLDSKLRKRLDSLFVAIVAPSTIRYPDQWADEHRVLPIGNAEAGRYRSSRTPYVVEPGREIATGTHQHVFFICASQMGKSSLMFNVMGHRLDTSPAPVLYVGPTENNVLNVVEPKLDAMLQGCPSLWAKTVRGQQYTKRLKRIAGTTLRLAWSGSPSELASDPACLVVVDEIDRMARSVRGEGSVIELADARHSTFPDGKTVGVSTPTLGNIDTYVDEATGFEHWRPADPESIGSQIWLFWQAGTRHEYALPCPHCEGYFIPRRSRLVYDDQDTLATIERGAGLGCPRCGAIIEQRHRRSMIDQGLYVAPGQWVERDSAGAAHVCGAAPEAPDASYWVSGLANFASKKTFGALARRYEAAVRSGDIDRVQGVVNTEFAECHAFGGDAPSWTAVAARRGVYKMGTVPEGVRYLVGAIDVQKGKLVYGVRGFGRAMESWGVDYGELYGDTRSPTTWEQATELLGAEYGGRPITFMAVDSGFRTDEVYQWVRANRPRAMATKGTSNSLKPWWSSPVDVRSNGRLLKGGIRLVNFDADVFRSWVHARIELGDSAPGAWHLPADVSDEVCRQIVNEERGPDGKWRTKGVHDYLDVESLLYLASQRLKHRLRARNAGAQKPKTTADESKPPTPSERPIKPPRWPRRRAGFVTRY